MTDVNKAIVLRFFDEVLTRQDLAAAVALVSPAIVVHHSLLPGGSGDLQAVIKLMKVFHDAFPDLAYTVEDVVAEGDKVAARWTAQGTHRGPFEGRQATGRAVTVAGLDLFAIADGRIVETWVGSDLLGLMRQLS